MRFLCLVLLMVSSTYASAAVFPDVKNIKELKSDKPGIFKFRVTEDEKGGGQAANYAQPNLSELYPRLLKEHKGLRALVKKVYQSYECDVNGHFLDSKLKDEGFCGELTGIEDANTVLWSFHRSGWMSANSVRKSFLTWQSAGTGNLTQATVEVTTKVSVEAPEELNLDDKPPVFDVVIDMSKFREIKN